MSNPDQSDKSKDVSRQQAEAERQIAQFEEVARRKRNSARRGCLGCAAIFAIPVIFFTWRLIAIGIGFSEAADFQRRVAAIGGRVRFWGSDDMGRGEGVKGVSTISIKHKDFSDDDMVKLAPLLIEAESFATLYLSRTQITDKGLQYFPADVKLGTLDLRDTDVTKAGVDQLLLRLPRLRNSLIRFDGGDVENGIVSPYRDSD